MADETPTLDIAKLDRLEKAATPGPWSARREETIFPLRGENRWRIGLLDFNDRTDEDGEFITALRNAAPALIAAAKERDELRAERDEAQELLNAQEDGYRQTAEALELEQANCKHLHDDNASLRALLVQAGEALSAIKSLRTESVTNQDEFEAVEESANYLVDEALAAIDARISALTKDTEARDA